MGIHDRPYYRSGSEPPPVYRRAAGWSATTWIIALCVSVFVVDGFLGWTLEPVRSVPIPGALAAGDLASAAPELDEREEERCSTPRVGPPRGLGVGSRAPAAHRAFRVVARASSTSRSSSRMPASGSSVVALETIE